jgi:putative SOS response-associated peptidase YedK
MGMAGIYEHWQGADGSEMESMAILTTAANQSMSNLHDRMPVIIAPEHFDAWLDCSSGSAEVILALLHAPPEDLLQIVEVSRKLNNPRNEGPQVQEPVSNPPVL